MIGWNEASGRLAANLLGIEWRHASGAVQRIECCLVDANWSQSTSLIDQFCRQSQYAAVLNPSHGKFIGPPAGRCRNTPAIVAI
jgi:hypothetical protein